MPLPPRCQGEAHDARAACRRKTAAFGPRFKKAVIDIERNKTIASRALWCFYFILCFLFLYWPVNALALLFGMFLKQRTATR